MPSGRRIRSSARSGISVGSLVGLTLVSARPIAQEDASPGAPAERPNIVLLIADDLKVEHLGFAGGDLARTPTLDTLAAEGVVFTTAHVPMSRCRPSLASLLSGLWPHQHGVLFNQGKPYLDPADSLPRLLRDAGYATYLGGKFWEDDPAAMGFQAAFTDLEGFVREGQEPLFAFIDEFKDEAPLFIWWAPRLPHYPYDPPQELVERFDASKIRVPASFAGNAAEYAREERLLLASTAWLDRGVHELREKLAQVGELDDTLFCFFADNGWDPGSPSKGSPSEAGLRTPIVFSGRGVPRGRRHDELVSTVDLYPTLLDFAGLPVPARAAGRSLEPWILGGPPAGREILFGALYPRKRLSKPRAPAENAYALYARTGEWKYVLYLEALDAQANDDLGIHHRLGPPLLREAADEDLYFLPEDPHEERDLAGEPGNAERLREFRASLSAWWLGSGGKPLPIR